MTQLGIKTASDLARVAGVSATNVGEILNMKKAPRDTRGEWTSVVLKLAVALHMEPCDMFSEKQLTMELKTNKGTVFASERQMLKLYARRQAPLLDYDELPRTLDQQDTAYWINKGISALPPTLAKIAAARFLEGKTHKEIASEMGRTSERIRQMECKILRALKDMPFIESLAKELNLPGAFNRSAAPGSAPDA